MKRVRRITGLALWLIVSSGAGVLAQSKELVNSFLLFTNWNLLHISLMLPRHLNSSTDQERRVATRPGGPQLAVGSPL
jgi:hypothetical protein